MNRLKMGAWFFAGGLVILQMILVAIKASPAAEAVSPPASPAADARP
jgi:hypothetical protein